MPSEAALKEIHTDMLQLLKELHEICISNGIFYSLHGGTLLGAVREKGFIPWDDDVDITMTRSEYEKLRTAVRQMADDCKIRLVDVERVVRVVFAEEKRETVWIDLFIYDYITDNCFFQKCKVYGILALGGLLKTKKGFEVTKQKVGVNYSWFKYVVFYVIYLIGKLFPTAWKLRWFHGFCKKSFCGKKNLVLRTNDQYTGLLLPLSVDVMKEYALMQFEDTKLMTTIRYHDVLVSCYGTDYMTPKRPESWHKAVHDVTREKKNISND